MRMKRMPTCPNVLASVISDVTSTLQKKGGQWFPQAKKLFGNACADTQAGDTPTITVIACTAHQHTVPHTSLLKIEKSWTNECDIQEHVWL